MPIRGILFDNDGTLVDTHDLILSSFRHATAAVLGMTPPDDVLMARVGTPLAEQMKDFTPDPALQAELLRVYRAHNHAAHDAAIALFPGVAEGLAALAAEGLAMGVVTAKRHELAQHGLEVLGVWERFGVLVGADDCPRFKPDPQPVRQAAAALGLAPEECLFVGDSPFDMQAGKAAGCATVAALWGMFPQEVLEAENPTYKAATFEDLVEIVCNLQ